MSSDQTFQPSFSLQKLVDDQMGNNSGSRLNEFRLNDNYSRQQGDTKDSQIRQDDKLEDLNALFTIGGTGRKEIQLIEDIKQKSLKKQRSDVYKKYQDFIEQEKQKIQENEPFQQRIQEEEDEKNEENAEIFEDHNTEEQAFDAAEYDRLMRPNQIKQEMSSDQSASTDEVLNSGQLFLLQFPPVLPFDQIMQTLNQSQVYQVKNLDDNQELLKEFYINDQYDSCGFLMKRSFKDFVSEDRLKINKQESFGIRLGKIQIEKGKNALLIMGDMQFELSQGISTVQEQELVGVDEANRKYQRYGIIRQKLVAKPQVENILMI